MPLPHLQRHQERSSMDQRRRMLETPIPSLICRLSVPTITSMMVTSIYNMADTYFVSQINTSASGAVGIVFSAMAIIQAVGFTIGVGSGSISSRLLGQEDREAADVCASSGVLMALVLGVLLGAVSLLNLEDLMWLLGSTPTIHPYAMDYAFYILLGAPVMVLAFTLNNLLRWQGKASLSVIGLTTGGVLNIILDPIFIYPMGMGTAGAGAATLLSQCVSLAILSSFFFTGRSELHLSPRFISRKAGVYLVILKQGMPSFFRQGVLSISTMALNYNARLYGDAAVAALAIVGKIFNFIQSVVIGFGQGFQPVVGYNFGAKRLDRVKQALVFSLRTCTIILTAAAVLGFLFSSLVIAFFRNAPLVIEIGAKAFRFQCLTLPLSAVLTFANMLFQALGKSFRATILAICRQGLYIPLVFLLSWQFQLTGLEMAQAVADLLGFLVSGSILLQYFLTGFKRDAAK